MTKIVFEDLKNIEYKDAWNYQEKKFNAIIDSKKPKEQNPEEDNYILFCEHPHVYTLGKSGTQNNLLINDEFLHKINASYYKTNRGGDITYHGPGQIVGYPILDLEKFDLSLKSYIRNLEEAIIITLKEYNLQTTRLDGATGVWLDVDGKNTRKICAIGVKASRYVTMHGFALNVNTDLSYFNHINPCGFVDKGVTSMEKELGTKINYEEIKSKLLVNLLKIFNAEISK